MRKGRTLFGCSLLLASVSMVGLSRAGNDPADETDVQSGPTFVSALEAGVVEIPEGGELSTADKAIFSRITPEQYLLLMAGQDPAAIGGQDGGTLDGLMTVDAVAAVGDSSANLTYTPIDPCRIIDTREFGTPNHFSPGETRSYVLSGKSDFTEYGGSDVCNLPGPGNSLPGDVGVLITERKIRAWALNIVAANPFTGQGNFFAYPANQDEPLASTINFSNLTPNLNIANGVIVKNCSDTGNTGTSEPLCPEGDLRFKANFSSARLVVDVQGYFTAGINESVKTTVTESGFTTPDLALDVGSCTNLTSCGRPLVAGQPAPAGKLLVHGTANFDVTSTSSTLSAYRDLTLTDLSATTCVLGRSDIRSSTAETRTPIPLQDTQLNVQGTFTVSAEQAKVVYLNGQVRQEGPGVVTTAEVNAAGIICTFIPD